IFGAAIADHHLVAENARRAGDRVGRSGDRVDFPDDGTVLGVEREEPPVEARGIDAALPNRDAAIDDVAAAVAAPLAGHFRIEAPDFAAALRIDRDGDAP